MSLWFWGLLIAIALVGWVAAILVSRRPITSAQQLIQQRRYEDAVMEATRTGNAYLRGEALKLLGRFEDAAAAYRQSDDPSAGEGVALSLAHAGHDLEEARALMEKQIAWHPQIQEFQALALAFILLRLGRRHDALRIYRDNLELLETRFRDDYTDPDPQLSEVLFLFSELAGASGDATRAASLRAQAERWGWSPAPPPTAT